MSLISFTQLQDNVTAVNAASINTPLNTLFNDYNGNITSANIADGSLLGTDLASSTVKSSNIDFTTLTSSLNNSTFITTVANTGAGGGNWTIYNIMGIKVAILRTGNISSGTGTTFTVSLPTAQFPSHMFIVAHESLNNAAKFTWQSGTGDIVGSSTIGLYITDGSLSSNAITLTIIGN